jgi:hypothetical protein
MVICIAGPQEAELALEVVVHQEWADNSFRVELEERWQHEPIEDVTQEVRWAECQRTGKEVKAAIWLGFTSSGGHEMAESVKVVTEAPLIVGEGSRPIRSDKSLEICPTRIGT